MRNPFRQRKWFTVRDVSGHTSDEDDYIPDEESRRKGLLIMGLALVVIIAILVVVGVQLMKVASDAEALEAYLAGWGRWGVLIYMLLVILQIIAAVVPGGPFEIAGGYLYGPFRGAVICDIAMTIGSVVVFLLSRRIGMKFVRMFFSKEQIDSVGWLKMSEKKSLVLFLIFLIPGMPKDIISYVAGLTDLPLGSWIFITAVGRFPAIYFSTLSGAALENRNYVMFVVVLAALCIFTAIGALVYKKKFGNHKEA